MEKLYHIGRDVFKNEIYIVDQSVSLSHAQILVDKNIDLIIIDLSSTNGVFVNNIRIQSPVTLKSGDVIKLGNLSFTKENILAAIKSYEDNKQMGRSANVSLVLQNKKNNIKKNYNNDIPLKYIIVTILIIIFFSVLFFLNLFFKTNELQKQRVDLIHDFTCLKSGGDGGTNELLTKLGDWTRDAQNTILKDVEISIDDEKQAGNELVNFIKQKSELITRGSDYDKLNRIMNNLVSRIANPRGVKYQMFFVDDVERNVYTLGGNIVFYRGMYKFCKSDSELAAIIAHEIAHNELGHSTLDLQKAQVFNKIDSDFIEDVALTFEELTNGFNQKQEVEADMFGIDLIVPTNYETCAGSSLWKRMSRDENENLIDNLFRTHPYSKNRSNCINHHLQSNYNIKCN